MKRFFLITLSLLIICSGFAKPKKLTQNLKWEYLPEGVLVISGYGAMPDWPAPQNEAWYKDGKWHKIKKVIIEEGVTSIGFKSFSPVGGAFERKTPLEVSLPSTVSEIGDFSFKGTPVKDLVLPEGVKRIGLGAFAGSLRQDSISFPTTLKSIADGAFMRSDIKKAVFHSDVVVEQGAFFECRPLNSIDFSNTWTELAPGAFEGNHKLMDLINAKNIRTPNGNPFIRTPLERSPEILAILGIDRPQLETERNEGTSEEAENEVLSEVDYKIPVMDGIDRERTFALVIGNQKYSREAEVPFANKDASVFSIYLNKTLGIPAKNIHLIKDASLNDMRYGLNLLTKTSSAFEGDINLIIYYAGHGVPDEATHDSFLLPVDGYGGDTSTGYSLKTFYDRLANIPSKSTVVFMDACFSGAKREGEMMASARGVAIVPKEETTEGNVIVFTASSGDETAFAYNDEGHGLFTYFLLKKLQENLGDVSLGELSDYISTKVKQYSIRENKKSQTPSVIVPGNMNDTWRDIKF